MTSILISRRGGLTAFAIVAAAGAAQGGSAMAPPEVTAKSVYVLNADTGQILYRRGDGKPVRLHSITKLITAHVLVQRMGGRLSQPVTIGARHLTTGSSAGLRKGDIWTLENLLSGMLLVSGNDAALAIADSIGRPMLAEEGKKGDAIKRFVKEMGPAAASLGAEHAKFADPHGLSPANVGTAQDVATIGAGVFRDERLLPFWRCARKSFEVGGPEARTVTFTSTVEMLGEDGILGAKTGSHLSKNIYNLVAGWRAPNGQTIVAVVLGSADHLARYRDMREIIAALPRDYPALLQPAALATRASASGIDCPERQAPPTASRP